jgi:DNA-binding beta-propeller fold protein YncE
MGLRLDGYIDLPAHVGPGGFDHAAIHEPTRRLYVAHTANDAVDVIDCARDVFVRSIDGLRGVAGVLVSEDLDRGLARCYVAVGDPGVIDVIDVSALSRLESMPTEPGAHTTALDAGRHRLYVFLPPTHRAAVFTDG